MSDALTILYPYEHQISEALISAKSVTPINFPQGGGIQASNPASVEIGEFTSAILMIEICAIYYPSVARTYTRENHPIFIFPNMSEFIFAVYDINGWSRSYSGGYGLMLSTGSTSVIFNPKNQSSNCSVYGFIAVLS